VGKAERAVTLPLPMGDISSGAGAAAEGTAAMAGEGTESQGGVPMSPVRRLILLVALAVLTLSAVGAAASSALASPPAGATDWTFAVYCDGDNDLEPYWDRFSLPWLLDVPASPGLHIVVLIDRRSTDGAQLVEIDGGIQTVVATYPEKDFGDGATLRWFIEAVHSRYPSTHLALTMWDHGYGWRYVCKDETSGGDSIGMDELHAAVTGAGVPIDILAFDACNMGDVDVAYEAALTHLVKIMVASEESVSANGYPYDKMLAPLADDPSLTPVQVAQAMVAGWKDYYDGLNWANTAQLAAVDVTRIAAAAPDLRAWARRLAADLPLYKKAYTRELKKTWHAWASNQYDFSDYCAKLIEDTQVKDATLKALTRTVKNDLADATIANATAPKSVPVTALTIWWDEHVDWKTWQADYLAHVSFAQPAPLGMGWWAFLNAYNQ
jgi:hypothetical protein